MSIYYIHQSHPQEHPQEHLGHADVIFHFQDREVGVLEDRQPGVRLLEEGVLEDRPVVVRHDAEARMRMPRRLGRLHPGGALLGVQGRHTLP